MMREIKFRAFVKHLKWMLPVEEIDFSRELVEVDLSNGNGDTSEYDFNNVEVMQFTGMTDKNRKVIYEGDYVKDAENGKIFEVFWNNLGCGTWWFATRDKEGLRCHARRIDLDDLEVIGNIYEHPHLLENKA